jgi:peptidoglycan/xylan/chitin deacetylase (PgdA/CDA1 family)
MKKITTFILMFIFSCLSCQTGTAFSYRENKIHRSVYLTFDDGPNAYLTPEVLDILKKQNVKASFFIVGINAANNKDILKRIRDEGHTIGVHCYRHIYKKIYKNAASFEADINSCLNVIKTILPDYKVLYYRFPGGSFNRKESYMNIVKKAGLKIIDWNCVNGDTQVKFSKSEIIDTVKTTSQGKKKAVLLMHDNKKITAGTLESVILYFKSKGYEFKKL